MEKMSFFNLVKKILTEENRPLSYMEIIEIAEQKGYDGYIDGFLGQGWKPFIDELYLKIENDPDSAIVKTNSKPTRFALRGMESGKPSITNITRESGDMSISPGYALLTYYAYKFLNVFCKDIIYKNITTPNYTKWVCPEVFGINASPDRLSNARSNDLRVEAGSSVSLYSFELVEKLGYYNLKETYFNALSTSLWANKSFLVVVEFEDNDEEILREDLKKLSDRYGVGIIKLDRESPDSSAVMFQSKLRDNIDIEMIDKLSEENIEFHNIVKSAEDILKAKKINSEVFNKVPELTELVN